MGLSKVRSLQQRWMQPMALGGPRGSGPSNFVFSSLYILWSEWLFLKFGIPVGKKNVSCFYMWSEIKPPGMYPNKRKICGSPCNLLYSSVHIIPENFQDGARTSTVFVVPIPASALCNTLLFILIYSIFKSRLSFFEHLCITIKEASMQQASPSKWITLFQSNHSNNNPGSLAFSCPLLELLN